MLGTPARLLIAIRTMLTSRPALAYSRKYRAARTPNGTTAQDISNVMATVPQIAGNTPPSVFASRGSSSRNSAQRAK